MKHYTIDEIKEKLQQEELPFTGITELGSARFSFKEPAGYAGTAIHSSSRIRADLKNKLSVSSEDRYREEDPGTDRFIEKLPIQVVALDSRFEYDVNRSEGKAIPLTPEMAWGLTVWKSPLIAEEIATSLAKYREFHLLMDLVSAYIVGQAGGKGGGGRAIIFDLHSYCYQREKREPWYENPKPVINLGTEAINDAVFCDLIDDFLLKLRNIRAEGRKVTVAENEVFKGGFLARRLSALHHENLAVFAIEFKKIFMDEWSGEFNLPIYEELVEQFGNVVADFVKDNLQ
jgi:hypothetical protein